MLVRGEVMSSVLSLGYWAEPFLMALALFALWRSKEYKQRFRALFVYFALRAAALLALTGVLHSHAWLHIPRKTAYLWYFLTYWSAYLVGAIVIFCVMQELFRNAMEPLPGLKRLGSIVFRWVACASLVAAFAALLAPNVSGYRLAVIACNEVMRCASIFILCLLFFLMFTANKLGLSYRSRIFGVCFGFGVLAAGDLVESALLVNYVHGSMMSSTLSIIDTLANVASTAIWVTFFLVKEPARQPVLLPATSSLSRWNEIATALGHGRNRIVVPAPAHDFFLQDVEKVVDRILTKNSLDIAS